MMAEPSKIKDRTLVDEVQRELLGRVIERCLIIKINSENLSTNGEICFPANLLAWRRSMKEDEIERGCKNILEHYLRRKNYDTSGLCEKDILEKAAESLVAASQAWPTKIQRCSLQNGRVCVFLNRTSIIGSVIREAVKRDADYGRRMSIGKSVTIKIIEDGDSDLTTARLRLVKEATERLLRHRGFDIVEHDADYRYSLTSKSEGKLEENYRRCVCGVAKSQDSNTKETSQTWALYVDKKIEELESLVETKSPALYVRRNVHSIAEAVVTFELLSVKPSRPVFIQTNADSDKAISSSKGGSFVLYNAVRIHAILEKFKDEERLGNYPNLSDVSNVDFDQLNREEEWELVYNFILGYPELITNCARVQPDLETCPQNLCLFLSRLSQKFSVYYRRIRVLTEGREHLIPTMMARLYLLRALQVVVNNSLAILNIVPVGHM